MNRKEIKLTDILTVEEWAELEKEIYERSGLDTSIYPTNGISITDYKQWANNLCPVIKGNKKGLSFICAVANQYMAQKVSQTRQPFVGECDAGLAKIAVPIFVGDEFLGTVGACGKFLDGSEIESFLISKTTGIEEEKIERLSVGIAKMTPTQAESLAAYIDKRIKEIVEAFEKSGEGKIIWKH